MYNSYRVNFDKKRYPFVEVVPTFQTTAEDLKGCMVIESKGEVFDTEREAIEDVKDRLLWLLDRIEGGGKYSDTEFWDLLSHDDQARLVVKIKKLLDMIGVAHDSRRSGTAQEG